MNEGNIDRREKQIIAGDFESLHSIMGRTTRQNIIKETDLNNSINQLKLTDLCIHCIPHNPVKYTLSEVHIDYFQSRRYMLGHKQFSIKVKKLKHNEFFFLQWNKNRNQSQRGTGKFVSRSRICKENRKRIRNINATKIWFLEKINTYLKMVTQETPEFPSFHGCTGYTATHRSVPSETNQETTWVTCIHWATEKNNHMEMCRKGCSTILLFISPPYNLSVITKCLDQISNAPNCKAAIWGPPNHLALSTKGLPFRRPTLLQQTNNLLVLGAWAFPAAIFPSPEQRKQRQMLISQSLPGGYWTA